jgi:hypothetical protein
MHESPEMMLRCGRCGEVRVRARTVEVHANRREDFVVYAFTCPGCAELVVGGCRQAAARLVEAGARSLELRSTSAPPVTYDDLLDFHRWLASDAPWPVEGL